MYEQGILTCEGAVDVFFYKSVPPEETLFSYRNFFLVPHNLWSFPMT